LEHGVELKVEQFLNTKKPSFLNKYFSIVIEKLEKSKNFIEDAEIIGYYSEKIVKLATDNLQNTKFIEMVIKGWRLVMVAVPRAESTLMSKILNALLETKNLKKGIFASSDDLKENAKFEFEFFNGLKSDKNENQQKILKSEILSQNLWIKFLTERFFVKKMSDYWIIEIYHTFCCKVLNSEIQRVSLCKRVDFCNSLGESVSCVASLFRLMFHVLTAKSMLISVENVKPERNVPENSQNSQNSTRKNPKNSPSNSPQFYSTCNLRSTLYKSAFQIFNRKRAWISKLNNTDQETHIKKLVQTFPRYKRRSRRAHKMRLHSECRRKLRDHHEIQPERNFNEFG
jgi:hypothetical protein